MVFIFGFVMGLVASACCVIVLLSQHNTIKYNEVKDKKSKKKEKKMSKSGISYYA